MACLVCVENFNKVRCEIKCEKCQYIACASCVKQYIIDKSYKEPHCMNCNHIWSIESMQNKFSKYFIRGEFRKTRENILFEREKTFLPALQPLAEKTIKIRKLAGWMEYYRKKIDENEKNEEQLVREQRETKREYEEKIKNTNKMIRKISTEEEKVAKKFIMKCNKDKCRGFLSEDYKCGMCNVEICKHCHVDIEEEKHSCNKDDIESIKELMKSTKPCPKCNSRIYKIDGCDQMFCIQCHTAFSWKTGLEEKGIVHNPHYFEALRTGNIAINQHRHREHQGECGPIPNVRDVFRVLSSKVDELSSNILRKMYQRFVHHREVTLIEMVEIDGIEDRLKFLTNDCDEAEFKQKIYVRHQSNLRRIEERQIFVTYVNIGDEIFRTLNENNITRKAEEVKTLCNITKESLERLKTIYEHAGFKKIKHTIEVDINKSKDINLSHY